jgi:hypothetical protein
MTATLDAMASKKKGRPEASTEQRAVEELVQQTWEEGLFLTGPDGLLEQSTVRPVELLPALAGCLWSVIDLPITRRLAARQCEG